MRDANITAPEESGDPAAEEAANRARAAGEITGDEIDAACAAFEAVMGHAPRADAPRTDDLYELPEDGDGYGDDAADSGTERSGTALEMQRLLDAAIKAAAGDSNDDEIDALRFALEHALTRWPEVDTSEF